MNQKTEKTENQKKDVDLKSKTKIFIDLPLEE
jgi:hypothetical protein